MSIQWREAMSIDQGVIDHDHLALIGVINEFCAIAPEDASVEAFDRILRKLEIYTSVHFAREEALQRAVRYSYADAHRHEHADLIRQLAEIRADLSTFKRDVSSDVKREDQVDGPEGGKGQLLVFQKEIAGFLHHWLIDHIIKSDLLMKPFAKKMGRHATKLIPLAGAVSWH